MIEFEPKAEVKRHLQALLRSGVPHRLDKRQDHQRGPDHKHDGVGHPIRTCLALEAVPVTTSLHCGLHNLNVHPLKGQYRGPAAFRHYEHSSAHSEGPAHCGAFILFDQRQLKLSYYRL